MLLSACGDDGGKATDAAVHHDDAAIDSPVADAAIDAADDRRGPKTISLTGPANSLFWDDAASTLYLTDNMTHTLDKFTDAAGVTTVATLPAPTAMQGTSLGDMIKQGGGSILIANFGFAVEGGIFGVNTQGTVQNFTGLDVMRRRIGLSKDSNGLVYDGYFTGTGMNPVGGVATVTFSMGAATETEIAGMTQGLKKVVGVVATPTAVFVSDATQKKIFKIAIPGNAFSELTTQTALGSTDLLIQMPNGDLLTGGGPNVQRITQAGVVTNIFTGFETVHGLAYDPTLKRLFIIDHSATVGVSDKLNIRPLDN